ncbi:blue light-inducible protein-like protein Bli-3 [Hortaea werneckii]|nr:blue light-inducible protein-like protein Bli-3 [Hortaea werneckii]
MPEPLTKEEVEKGQDPSVTKQWDNDISPEKKFEDFYAIVDKQKIGMLGTYRDGIGPVSRAMSIARRTGPDFLFLANTNSVKFSDLESHPEAQIVFHNSSNQDWVCVTGQCSTSANDDPRIQEVWSQGVKAWFGDLKDGRHDGGPQDPRMKLIEIKAKYISYWKHEAGPAGFAKEVGGAILTGGVANTGALRQMQEHEIQQARQNDSSLSS